MSFISSVAELFKGKKAETPVAPTLSLEEKQQELASLQSVASSPAGKDFRSPQTDAQDVSRIKDLRNQIAEIKSREPTPPQTTPPDSGITQIPAEQPQTPVEEPQAA